MKMQDKGIKASEKALKIRPDYERGIKICFGKKNSDKLF